LAIVIFDLDGTLCDISHRRPLVEGKNKDWDEFYKQCVKDSPKHEVIKMFKLLQSDMHTMVIFSGRSDVVRKETYQWLRKNEIRPDILIMREDGDFTPDDKLKKKWLQIINKSDILCVFDDRDRIVKMWREEGLTCFQVADGNF